MYTPAGRRGTFLLVAILLLISILLEQWIALLCPFLGDMGGIRPMMVFLDIPVRSPVVIDWAPVGFIFILFYSLVVRSRRPSLWGLLWRWWLLLGCMLAGGGIYYLLEDNLSRQVRNGIDSFGIRADIVLPYPFEDTVHLQGSMIMLVFCIIGWRMLVKKAVLKPVAEEKVRVEGKKLVMQIPDPVEVKTKPQPPVREVTQVKQPQVTKPQPPVTRKACMPVAMPVTAIRNNGVYPCIVDGEIKPAVFRAKDSRSVSRPGPGQFGVGRPGPDQTAMDQPAPSTSTTS
jgi:hypothetical protein